MSGSILIVDDDPNVVELITETLKTRGYETDSAYDGERALEKYDETHPKLVLLDVILPKKDGFQVCSEIRKRNSSEDTPIIMISSDYIPETMIKGFKAGAQDFIKKPFSLKEILAKVENLITQAEIKHSLKEHNELLEGEVQKGQDDYERINRELRKKILNMRTLFGLSQDLNRLRDPDELVHIFFLTIIGQLGIGSIALFSSVDEREEHLSFSGSKGIQDNVLMTVRLSSNTGLPQYLLSNHNIVDLNSPELPEDARREAQFMAKFGLSFCYPLVVKSKILGIVFIGDKVNEREYLEDDFEVLKSICNSAATGLENGRLYKELEETYLSTIKILVSTIEAKDSYTKGHTERVAEYASMLAEEMGLDKKEIDVVRFGAALHDIGKLGIYEDILNKPGELTKQEWMMVRSHPEVGANIIKNMKFLESACDLVEHHHERLDGSGYPHGLRDGEISTGARIVAVADSFDAMTSDRPYRGGLSVIEALKELEKQYDKFDERVIGHLADLIKEGRIKK